MISNSTNTNTIEDSLFKLIREAQDEAARNYVKKSTSFVIGYPEGNDKLHVMLVDAGTREVIKKVNCTRFLLDNLSEELLGIFKRQVEKDKAA